MFGSLGNGELQTGALATIHEIRLTAVPSRDSSADGEADADAGVRVNAIQSAKHGKSRLSIPGVDADAVVAHANSPESVVVSRFDNDA
jgi:hypothetical protein